MKKLDGKVAIVTGAGRGLGRAYALRLAGLGAKIAVCDLDLHSFAEFEAEAKAMTGASTMAEVAALGSEAIGIQLDVTDQAAVQAMVDEVVGKWGRVDILVCNAGGGRGRPVDTKASTLDPALLRRSGGEFSGAGCRGCGLAHGRMYRAEVAAGHDRGTMTRNSVSWPKPWRPPCSNWTASSPIAGWH